MSDDRRRGCEPALVSVVVPVRNGADTIADQLRALAAQDYQGDWELVVVDNGSTDRTADVVRSWSDRLPGLRLTTETERFSVSAARNAGALAARGQLLVFCDADDVVVPGWLASHVRSAARADIVGGRIDDSANDPVHLHWRGHVDRDSLMVLFEFLPFAPGCNFSVWRDVVLAHGGWDEHLVGGSEDVDFCWRVQLAGGTIVHEPDAVVDYRYRTSLRGVFRQFYRSGRTESFVYARFRGREHDGTTVTRPTLRRTARWTVRLLRRAPGQLARRQWRGRWIRDLAHRCGRGAGHLHLLRPSVRAWVGDDRPMSAITAAAVSATDS